MLDPDLELRRGGGGGPGHPDPEIRGGGGLQIFLLPFGRASVSSKNKRGSPLNPPLNSVLRLLLSTFTYSQNAPVS